MPSLCALAFLAVDLAGLSLTVSTPRDTVLVGEPVKATVRWRANTLVRDVAVEDQKFLFQSIRLVVERDGQVEMYREAPHEMHEKLLVRRRLAPGEEVVTEHVFHKGGYTDETGRTRQLSFLFPKPGVFWVRAVYVHLGVVTDVRSNRIRFEVKEPVGSDAVVMDAIRTRSELLAGEGGLPGLAATQRLLDRYPRTPYLRMFKLSQFRQRSALLGAEYDPDTQQSFFHLGEEGRTDFKRRYYARMVEEVLAEPDWSPFGDDALALAAVFAIGAGDTALAERLKKELIEKNPDSPRAARVRRTMDP
jgi:hypothetical protein